MNYGVGHRSSSDPKLLWLWCTPAAAAPPQPLAWGPPYAVRMTLKRQIKKKEKKKRIQCRSQLQPTFNLWPRNFHMPQVQPLKKKKSTLKISTICHVSSRGYKWFSQTIQHIQAREYK